VNQCDARDLQKIALACIREWESVNDPPCHPSDPGWKGCALCRAAQKQETPAVGPG